MGGQAEQSRPAKTYSRLRLSRLTNPTLEPPGGGPQRPAPTAPGPGRASSVETLAYTCAMDLVGDPEKALSLARDLLKDVRKSGLKSPFADALLRRLALTRWTKMDRPRPTRLELKECKESHILLFFMKAWDATYEDLAAALAVSDDRARHLVHKARMEQVATLIRIPIPKPECRRPRELLSDYREALLPEPLTEDVAQHLRGCRDCSALDHHLLSILMAPPRPHIEPPPELVGAREARPTLSLTLDAVSRTQRRAGLVLLGVGMVLGVVQFHPGLNASAAAQMDRLGAAAAKWRNRGERLVEDLRVLKALALGTVEGRTEELTQTLDEYVNSPNPSETSNEKNKPAADAVLDSRDPKNQAPNQTSPGPVKGSRSPQSP